MKRGGQNRKQGIKGNHSAAWARQRAGYEIKKRTAYFRPIKFPSP